MDLKTSGLIWCATARLVLAQAGGHTGAPLPAWTPGTLDIHQISTGRGNAAFSILPDGTTLLVDAGAAGDGIPETGPHPNASRSPGAWIADYIQRHLPTSATGIDYALITHFHGDHMGQVTAGSPLDRTGAYRLTGITEVGDAIRIRVLLDRGWPDYSYPAPIADETMTNYRRFLKAQQQRGMTVERFRPGSSTQLRLWYDAAKYPAFEIRNIVANGEVWTQSGDSTRQLFPPLDSLARADWPSENMCSLGIRLSYGRFRYFTGGDLPGTPDPGFPAWQAIEAAVAPVIGQVDAHVVNQHGSMGEESEAFLQMLRSTVLIVPSWAPSHPAPDVLKRIMNSRLPPAQRLVFATDLREAARIVIGQRAAQLAGPPGHIVIRVAPEGDRYWIFVLDNRDERDLIVAAQGPFTAGGKYRVKTGPLAACGRFANPGLSCASNLHMLSWIESTFQDLRYAARLLRLNPGFFAVTTLSLALGIGANTAIFQLLDAVRLRMLPVPHPDQLAELQIADNEHCCSGNFSARRSNFTYPQWEQIHKHQQAFSSIFAYGDRLFNLADAGEARRAAGLWVSGQYFQTLGVLPVLGRLITDEDDRPGCGSPGVVIGNAFWQREFGGDPQVIGKQVLLDNHRLPVLGVAPSRFFGVEVGRDFDVALPLCAEPIFDGEDAHMNKRHHWWLAIIGRLKPGWTLARTVGQVSAMSATVFENTVPPNYRPDQAKYYAQYKLTAVPAGSGVSPLRQTYEQPLLLLMGIAGLVLLIACANLANLMLARASMREREMAVRLAIGAGRGQLVRQLLVESFLLTLIGTGLGIMAAQFLSRYLVSFLTTADNRIFLELRPDWRLLAFTSGIALLTTVLVGLWPAIRASRTVPASAMKTSGRGLSADSSRSVLRRGLVVSQVALSLVLLVGALLFVTSFHNLVTLDAGFREDGVLVMGIDISKRHYAVARRAPFYRDLLDRVRATHGVDAAAIVNIVQISGSGWNDAIEIPGQPAGKRMVPWFNRVSADYFRVMGTPLLAGRDFNDRDTVGSPDVAVVNEKFRDKFLAGADPLGKQFRVLAGPGEPSPVYQIVGVVKNSKYQRLRNDFEPIAFVAEAQHKEPGLYRRIIVHSSAPLGPLMTGLKRTVLNVDPDISLEFTVFRTQVRDSLLRDRLMAALSGFFGFLAVILATIGLYGVISYMAARRRNEIGIRIALGANRIRVLRLVLREAGMLLVVGLAIGTALSIAAGRTASSLLYGVQPADRTTIALAIALLAVVALVASFIPALRASRVEPMAALREE